MEHCTMNMLAVSGYSLPVGLFLGALAGSITHCIGMCGPFVLAQSSALPPSASHAWLRALLIPYHLGRLTTYTLLGVLAAMLIGYLPNYPSLHLIPPFLLMLASMMFLASAFADWQLPFGLCKAPQGLLRHVNALIPSHTIAGRYVLGVLLGFLPCGLVYAGIMAASATGNALDAALAMIGFALGTMPALMAMSLGSKFFLRYTRFTKPIARFLMLASSFWLFVLAVRSTL